VASPSSAVKRQQGLIAGGMAAIMTEAGFHTGEARQREAAAATADLLGHDTLASVEYQNASQEYRRAASLSAAAGDNSGTAYTTSAADLTSSKSVRSSLKAVSPVAATLSPTGLAHYHCHNVLSQSQLAGTQYTTTLMSPTAVRHYVPPVHYVPPPLHFSPPAAAAPLPLSTAAPPSPLHRLSPQGVADYASVSDSALLAANNLAALLSSPTSY
jgi:hypothetical protein